MNNFRIIDADGHVQERDADWQELLEPPYRKHAPKMIAGPDGKEQLLLEGKIWAKPSGAGLGIGTAPYSRRPQKTTGMFDPVRRLDDMDLENIDTAVNFGTTVFLSLPFLENHDLACAIAHAYNTWLHGYCKTNPQRLSAASKNWASSPSPLRRIQRGATWIIRISILSTPRLRNSAFRCAFMSAPAGPRLLPIVSITHFLSMQRRMRSSR